jgi:hypothetical protein
MVKVDGVVVDLFEGLGLVGGLGDTCGAGKHGRHHRIRIALGVALACRTRRHDGPRS